MSYDLIFLMVTLSLFPYWFSFSMGNPLAKEESIDVHAILFFIPLSFAIKRLEDNNLLSCIVDHQDEEMKLEKNIWRQMEAREAQKKALYVAGRDFFTWEKMFLCPVCLHFWLTVVAFPFALIFLSSEFLPFVFLYFVTHLFIRKIL